jgi:hypothetical protein
MSWFISIVVLIYVVVASWAVMDAWGVSWFEGFGIFSFALLVVANWGWERSKNRLIDKHQREQRELLDELKRQ